jgi:hypothetical protein
MTTTTPRYTMPAEHFCPTCLIHNRAQDGFGGDGKPTFLAECPVCAHKRRTGEPIIDAPAWDARPAAWSTWVRDTVTVTFAPLARAVGL